MATMERQPAGAEGGTEAGLLNRVKKGLGLGTGPKEHKVDEFHEQGGVKPETQAPAAPVGPHEGARGENVGVQKLLKPQEVEVGLQKPPSDVSWRENPVAETDVPPTPLTAPATPVQHTLKTPGVASSQDSPAAREARRLEALGYEHKGGSMGPEGKAGKAAVDEPPEPVQGDRIKVARVGGVATGGMTEVEARPGGETRPMYGEELGEMRAHKHELRVAEKEREIEGKRSELERLRHQAEELERQSQSLLEEAAVEKDRIDSALAKKQQIEHVEWRGYVLAERAEAARREVVDRAKPAVASAQELEGEAVRLRQAAADVEYHAQVLERRAKALVEESGEMAALSADKTGEASLVAAELSVRRQEAEEIRGQIDTQAALGLPNYIQECEREIGVLSRRIAELREEISWAQQEIQNAREEADTWRRILVAKESAAAHLLMRLMQLREDAEMARLRSSAAAEEAGEPARLAEEKYREAWALGREASEMETRAVAAQEEAMELAKGAVEPTSDRQANLREAADAEAVLRQVDAQVEVVAGKAERRLAEAEVKATTAAQMAEQAQRIERDLENDRKILEAEAAEVEMHRAEFKKPMAVPVV